ncbi:opsin-5-like [Branchiostoma lanceolatum]|uniref:opsin-5-like n=1 Tax=Branchiostoma lanceolatum TaxID=7740 RepID=UPI003453DFD6
MATTPGYRLDDLAPTDGGEPTAETHDDAFASKLSREADIVIGVYLILIGTGSVLGNGRVLWLSYRNWAKLRPVELFVVSLAVTDVGISLFGYPFAATSSLLGRWSFGSAGCTWYGFTGFFFGTASIANMALMSIMRFMIVYKKYPGPYPTRPQTYVIIAVAWLYGLFWACAPLAGWSRYHVEPFGLSCTVDWGGFSRGAAGMSFILCLLVFCVALPVTAVVASFAGIFVIYRHAKKGVVTHLQNNPTMSKKRKKMERALTLTALAVCGGFLLAWLPYAVVGLWSAVAGVDAVPLALASAAPLFAKSSSLWNPIIYLGTNNRFRLNMCACLAKELRTQTAVHAQQLEMPARLSPRGPLALSLPAAADPQAQNLPSTAGPQPDTALQTSHIL